LCKNHDLKKNKMSHINRTLLLNTLIRHETLTIVDIAKKENLGIIPDRHHLNFLLEELIESGDIDTLDGVTPCTYTITDQGIKEGARLNENQ
jgi:hypothetical protein